MQNSVKAQEDSKWSRVALRITSAMLNPPDISEKLRLEPTKTHLKGSVRSARHGAVWPSSLWLLNSALSDQSDMAEHIRYFLDLLEPKASILNDLLERCEIDLFCGFCSGNGQGGFTLAPTILRRLAGLQIPIVFDLYPPSVSADEIGEGQ